MLGFYRFFRAGEICARFAYPQGGKRILVMDFIAWDARNVESLLGRLDIVYLSLSLTVAFDLPCWLPPRPEFSFLFVFFINLADFEFFFLFLRRLVKLPFI